MSRVPLPERGQPLDVAYLYGLSVAINDISDQLVSNNNKNVTVDTPGYGSGRKSVIPSDSKTVGAYLEVARSSKITAGNQRDFTCEFATPFLYPPIVVASPINIDGTKAGGDVSVVLQSITEGSVKGSVTFNTSGEASLALNIIAIGIPVNAVV